MTERERLQWLIDGIRSSVNKSEVGCFYSLEYFLSYLFIYDFNLDNNQDLWQEFKIALQEHYLLKEGKEAYDYFNQPDMVGKGYWWFNPESWK